jgi:hypothetical protein
MPTKEIEFGGTVHELAEVLEDLIYPEAGPKRDDYWIEEGPFLLGARDRDHNYFQVIVVDDENERIYFGG